MTPNMALYRGFAQDALPLLETQSVNAIVTSPPYWQQRNYGHSGQLGREPTPTQYINSLVGVFDACWRVLTDDGVCYVNLGDKYASRRTTLNTVPVRPKELIGLPFEFTREMRRRGWHYRRDIIWAKSLSFCPNYVGSCAPEPVKDRPTTSHEYLLMFTKSEKYFYDYDAVTEQGVYPAGTKGAKGSGTRQGNRRKAEYATYSGRRNLRSVWAIPIDRSRKTHQATFPDALAQTCIAASVPAYVCHSCGARFKTGIAQHDAMCCPAQELSPGVILDPFMGSGTVARVAHALKRSSVGIESHHETYTEMVNDFYYHGVYPLTIAT